MARRNQNKETILQAIVVAETGWTVLTRSRTLAKKGKIRSASVASSPIIYLHCDNVPNVQTKTNIFRQVVTTVTVKNLCALMPVTTHT